MKTPRSSDARKPADRAVRAPRAQNKLFSSSAAAKRENAGLRRAIKRIDSAPSTADTNIRSSLT